MAAIVIPFNLNCSKHIIEPTQIILNEITNIKLLEKICLDCNIDAKYCVIPVLYIMRLKAYIRTHMMYSHNYDLDNIVIHYNKILI